MAQNVVINGVTYSNVPEVDIPKNGGGTAKFYDTASANSTQFASNGTGGTLYVPQALISSYQSATNWSTILGYANNSIQAIEGSQYENYYADGTPMSRSQ